MDAHLNGGSTSACTHSSTGWVLLPATSAELRYLEGPPLTRSNEKVRKETERDEQIPDHQSWLLCQLHQVGGHDAATAERG
jgi:hypothetical protein